MNQFKTIAFKDGSISLDVRVSVEDGTIWLSAKEMTELFGCGASTVRRHIKKTYNQFLAEGCAKKAKAAHTLLTYDQNRNVPIYNEKIIKGVAESLHSDKYTKLLYIIKNHNVNLDNDDNIIIYNNGSISLDVTISPKEETVWLTQAQIAILFDTTRQNITMHIKNIFDEGELTKDSVSKDFLHTAPDSKQYLTTIYNLDLILAIGYRVKGQRAIEFRKWVTDILKQYLINGYSINSDRAKTYSDIILNLESETLKIKEEIEKIKSNINNNSIKEKLFVNGQVFDAHEFFCSLMRQAKYSIKIIDPYFDDKGLAILSKSQRVDRTVYLSHPGLLNKKDISNFKSQYGEVKIKTIKDYHDRFIIIDDIDCYLIGTSLNNAGCKTFVAIKIESKDIITTILNSLDG